MKEKQVIISAGLCKHLLDEGFHIVDIDKSKKDNRSTVFIFDYSNELQKEMERYFYSHSE